MAKIVAQTNTDRWHTKYLVEMTKDEIAHLMGERYASSIKNGDDVFKIGAEIPIYQAWDRLDHLATIQRTLDGTAGELRKVADWLDTVPSVMEPPAKKSSKKETTDA